MKFLSVPVLEKLNELLRSVEVGEQLFQGRVQCFTLKMVKDDKRLASHLRRAFASERLASRLVTERVESVHSSISLRDAMERAYDTPLGSLRDAHTLKLMEYLISTLNNVYQDELDFTDVSPEQFSKVSDLESVKRMVGDQLQALDRTLVHLADQRRKQAIATGGGSTTTMRGPTHPTTPVKKTLTRSPSVPPITADGISPLSKHGVRLDHAAEMRAVSTGGISGHKELGTSKMGSGSGSDLYRIFSGYFVKYFWDSIDSAIDLGKCETFRFHPSEFEMESMRPNQLWSVDLFFLNDADKRMVYVSLATLSKLFGKSMSSTSLRAPMRPMAGFSSSPLIKAMSEARSMHRCRSDPTGPTDERGGSSTAPIDSSVLSLDGSRTRESSDSMGFTNMIGGDSMEFGHHTSIHGLLDEATSVDYPTVGDSVMVDHRMESTPRMNDGGSGMASANGMGWLGFDECSPSPHRCFASEDDIEMS